AEAVAGAELVLLSGLARADEIPEGLMGGVGNPHRRKITRPVAAGEPGGVPPIGLDAIARFGGHEGGGDDVAVDTKLGQLPVEHVAAGPSLVAGVKPMAGLELPDQLRDGLGAIGEDAEGPNLAVRLRDGGGDRLGLSPAEPILQDGDLRRRNRLVRAALLLAGGVALAGCGRKTELTLFELLPPSTTGVTFINAVPEQDTALNMINFLNYYNGG